VTHSGYSPSCLEKLSDKSLEGSRRSVFSGTQGSEKVPPGLF
jgi:hypothetical protein